LQFGATSAALLLAIGAAATPILLPIPFIGPFLAITVNAILAAIAVAGVTGFLGPIITQSKHMKNELSRRRTGIELSVKDSKSMRRD
jgi:hypothetical protein